MKYWITPDGSYYEAGGPVAEGSIPVTKRPTVLHDWVNSEWVVNQQKLVDKVQVDVISATQSRLDSFAMTRGYDGILSACTYAVSTNPKFSAEGQYCIGIRDATWAKLYQIMDEVLAGTRVMPSGFSDIEADLPLMEWPV